MTVPNAADVETTARVPPLKTSPMRVGPWAYSRPTEGSKTATGVAALASAIGAAIASAVMTPVAKAARLAIGLMRLVVGNGLLR
jgi:hypothetical protein